MLNPAWPGQKAKSLIREFCEFGEWVSLIRSIRSIRGQ
jgi:hypothetical protein